MPSTLTPLVGIGTWSYNLQCFATLLDERTGVNSTGW